MSCAPGRPAYMVFYTQGYITMKATGLSYQQLVLPISNRSMLLSESVALESACRSL